MGRRFAIYGVSLAILIAVLVPGVLPGPRDSFPLSIYPMYAWARPPVVDVPSAVLRADDAATEVRRLSLETIGGVNDPLVVSAGLRDAIRGGFTAEACAEIAGRLRVAGDVDGVVEVVMERHDLVGFLAGDEVPLERTVFATCEVTGVGP